MLTEAIVVAAGYEVFRDGKHKAEWVDMAVVRIELEDTDIQEFLEYVRSYPKAANTDTIA